MGRSRTIEYLTTRETYERLTVPELRAMCAVIRPGAVGRKQELVDLLVEIMENPEQVRSLYAQLGERGQRAVQEATHDPDGVLHLDQFRAKYGHGIDLGSVSSRSGETPTLLRLFLPREVMLPTDLRATLLTFVPKPAALQVANVDELPATIRLTHRSVTRHGEEPAVRELRVRKTARAAQLEIKALLRLVDAGEVRVGENTGRPSQASMKAIAAVLTDGEYYGEDDGAKYKEDPAWDLTMKAFAWPILLQAGGLARASGNKLELTPTGRKATTKPAHEIIRQIWDRWPKSKLLDEFRRIDVIKGQQTRGTMTPVERRREAVLEALAGCTPGKWMTVEEVFRILKASGNAIRVTNNEWNLYLCEQQYGSFGYSSDHTWEQLQGRYTLAVLFEYVATLGVVDVAYITPDFARDDFHRRWGTDEMSCLSRYDGLKYVRLNSLGAWCLGLEQEYEPEQIQADPVLRVLPNLEIVAGDKPLDPGDVLLLERFGERRSEAVWQLTAGKILAAVEQGLPVGELQEFLKARSRDPIPQTVETFLADLAVRTKLLQDMGTARMVACADANVAQLLANDRRLRSLCQLAGERHLVFQAADETAVRRALRDLGYVLPPQ